MATTTRVDYDDAPDVNGFRLKYAYIQFAGFTFGKATSNFDFWAGDFYEGIDPGFFYSDATPNQIAYTADFGNGFSATIAIEDAYERTRDYFDDDRQRLRRESPGSSGYRRQPELRRFVGRGSPVRRSAPYRRPVRRFRLEPNDDWGWAVLAGVRFDIAETTTIYVEGAYADGALGYLGFGATGVWLSAMTVDFAGCSSSVDVDGDSISGWYVGGGIRHYWVPTVFTSLVGSYGETDNYTARCLDDRRQVASSATTAFLFEHGKNKVYSLAANIGWKPVKGLQFVLQYDRVCDRVRLRTAPSSTTSRRATSTTPRFSGKSEQVTGSLS